MLPKVKFSHSLLKGDNNLQKGDNLQKVTSNLSL